MKRCPECSEIKSRHQEWCSFGRSWLPDWLKRWLWLGAVLVLGCSHLTVAPKPVNAHAIAFDKNTQNAGVIDCDANGCKVTVNWVAKYKQMEAEFKQTFPDDINIKAEGKHFRAPYDVIEHFTTMKATERGGP